MGLREVKAELENLDKKQLIKLVGELYKKYPSVKQHLDFYADPKEEELLKTYKQNIYKNFYPERGFGLNLKEAKKYITQFKKLEVSTFYLADLMLYYVECGVQFTNDFGDIDENFYISMEKMYYQTLELMNKSGLLDHFQPRAEQVVTDTKGMGWGFHDGLCDSYYTFYSDHN